MKKMKMDSLKKRDNAEKTPNWRTNEIKKYIAENYYKKINVSGIAKEFNVTPQYLSNLFKNETGYTVVGYLLDERIKVAKRLLAEKDLKILQISEMVGYPNPSYFSKTFKRLVGRTPEQYRSDIFKE